MEKYTKIRKIGEGAFGKANLVRHKQSNKQFVIKEINIIRMSSKEREGSRKEVAVLAQLDHPNIVAYRESFEEHGFLYIVMDFCAGGDLYAKINSQRGILFSEDQVLDWFVQMCLAIKHIHDRKILHRDIKSQNIFLTNHGEVQIGDFGIAKVLNSTVELARTCIGTPYYLSPEIVENKPYNNKSDIWSLGCVLYELTTLKHAFEAGNMKNLVLKIIRGSYPPVPTKYSYDIRNLIAQLFKRSPRDRPSINTVLKKNFITQRVRKFLTEDELASEFSHTVMHGHKIARALPPPPRREPGLRPSSAAGKRAPPKPARYDPSAVCGAPEVKKYKENRALVDRKKQYAAAPDEAVYRDIQHKKQELIEREKKREEEQRKMAQINKSREEGWRNIAQNLGYEEPKEMRNDDRDFAREQMRWPAAKPVEDQKPLKDRGNYEQYHAYLDKLQQERKDRVRQQPQCAQAPAYMYNRPEDANWNKFGGEAAERARLVEEFIQRKKQAARNKIQGQAQLFGYTPPCTPVQEEPVAKPARVAGTQFRPLSADRNKEEQEYIEKLRKIRQHNFAERQNNQAMLKDPNADNGRPQSAREDVESKRRKMEALRQQADERAQKLKDQLELKRKEIFYMERKMWERQQNKFLGERPSSDKKTADMKPAAAVPITGVLRAIGAKPTPADDCVSKIESEERSNFQQQREKILKRINEQGSPREQWGDCQALRKEEVPEEEPESSRLKWGGAGGDALNLGQLPLEQTASGMEATSARDQVIKNPDEAAAGSQLRRQWGPPGNTVINALKEAPISSSTTTSRSKSDDILSSSSQSSKAAPHQPKQPAVAHVKESVAYTITLSKGLVGKETITILPSKAGSKLPTVESNEGAGSLFDKAALDDKEDAKKEERKKENIEVLVAEEEKDRPKTAVLKGLSTGHFDMGDVQLLRTCSEPDLSKFAVSENCALKTGLLSSSVGNLNVLDKDNVSKNKLVSESNENKGMSQGDESEKKMTSQEADLEDSDEEDIDELLSVKETMKSFLLQNSDDKSNGGSDQFSLSSADRGNMPAEKDNETGTDKTYEAAEDDFKHSTEENDDLDLFQTDDDSDENGDEEDDYELYSRLEESRAELENQLGCTKFLKVYKTVQTLQEDEDENMENGARITIELLGKEHEALYPRIFQLVMADAIFSEDNE